MGSVVWHLRLDLLTLEQNAEPEWVPPEFRKEKLTRSIVLWWNLWR